MQSIFHNNEIYNQVDISQSSSNHAWDENSQKNYHKWDSCIIDISWFLIRYEKVDDYDENDVDISITIDNDYIVVYEAGSTNRSRLLGLRDHSSENDEIEDWIWDDKNEWEEG